MPFDPPNPARKALSLFEEFKKFAFKGNLIDMAVAVVIGTAFSKLVDSFVKDFVMNFIAGVIGLFGGAPDTGYAGWTIPLGGVQVNIGAFLGELVNFLLLAFVVFIFMVKFLGLLVKRREEAPPAPTREQELLAEIRDLLKARAAP